MKILFEREYNDYINCLCVAKNKKKERKKEREKEREDLLYKMIWMQHENQNAPRI